MVPGAMDFAEALNITSEIYRAAWEVELGVVIGRQPLRISRVMSWSMMFPSGPGRWNAADNG